MYRRPRGIRKGEGLIDESGTDHRWPDTITSLRFNSLSSEMADRRSDCSHRFLREKSCDAAGIHAHDRHYRFSATVVRHIYG